MEGEDEGNSELRLRLRCFAVADIHNMWDWLSIDTILRSRGSCSLVGRVRDIDVMRKTCVHSQTVSEPHPCRNSIAMNV